MGRIQGLSESALLQADTLLKSGEGYVFHITLAYKDVAAGEFCTIIDGTAVATGTDIVMIIFPATTGTIEITWPQGKKFTTGLFFNKGATLGSVFAELTYK